MGVLMGRGWVGGCMKRLVREWLAGSGGRLVGRGGGRRTGAGVGELISNCRVGIQDGQHWPHHFFTGGHDAEVMR